MDYLEMLSPTIFDLIDLVLLDRKGKNTTFEFLICGICPRDIYGKKSGNKVVVSFDLFDWV